MDPIHRSLLVFAVGNPAGIGRPDEFPTDRLRDSLGVTVGLIAAAASLIVCLVNRLTRTGTVARENVRLMYTMHADRAGGPAAPDAGPHDARGRLVGQRMAALERQNRTLLNRYCMIRLILALLYLAVLIQVGYVVVVYVAHIIRVEPRAAAAALSGFGVLFLACLLGSYEWLRSVDALGHEVRYGHWLARGAKGAPPEFVNQVLLWYALDITRVSRLMGRKAVHSWDDSPAPPPAFLSLPTPAAGQPSAGKVREAEPAWAYRRDWA